MADQTNSVERPDRDELQRELELRDEEILRLRDLLIGRDAELGGARGRLEILEQGSQRFSDAAGRIRIPGATRVINGLLVWLQGHRG